MISLTLIVSIRVQTLLDRLAETSACYFGTRGYCLFVPKCDCSVLPLSKATAMRAKPSFPSTTHHDHDHP
jgi:hypothetical protein